jgi:hypothetical protein
MFKPVVVELTYYQLPVNLQRISGRSLPLLAKLLVLEKKPEPSSYFIPYQNQRLVGCAAL